MQNDLLLALCDYYRERRLHSQLNNKCRQCLDMSGLHDQINSPKNAENGTTSGHIHATPDNVWYMPPTNTFQIKKYITHARVNQMITLVTNH